jgi:hypothetical protein
VLGRVCDKPSFLFYCSLQEYLNWFSQQAGNADDIGSDMYAQRSNSSMGGGDKVDGRKFA